MGYVLKKTGLEKLLAALKGSHLAPYSLASYHRRRPAGPAAVRILYGSQLFPSGKRELSEREQTDPRLAAVADALEQLDRSKTISETVALCCETVIEHFEVAGLAIALRGENGADYGVTGAWQLPEDLGTISDDGVGAFVSKTKSKKNVAFDARMRAALPSVNASRCSVLPLQSRDQLLGFLLIIDSELRRGDLMLLSMVAQAGAARLSSIIEEAEQAKAKTVSERLMSLSNSLLLVDNKEELYASILSIASDLVEASQSSIMLLDEKGEEMEIAFTRGISLDVVHSVPVKVGIGIAGTVAKTGEPLLVNDVEKDFRTAMTNRPRFKSKSLLCVPLKLKEKVIGVLNLAEKRNFTPFTNADLKNMGTFANLASVMIERTQVVEKSMRFEQLSVTDALTGLYNRRFLKSRLEEELNRSTHQGLSVTILFIDLDHFKGYNDVCGHLAGDQALKKTADIIKGSVREMDIVARYGGEEFCAVLPGTSKAEAMLVADRIRAEIESERFPAESDVCFRSITASIGVASFPEDGRTFTALVHASDVALYEAKAFGRNRIVAARSHERDAVPAVAEIAVVSEPVSLARTVDFNAYLEASRSNG